MTKRRSENRITNALSALYVQYSDFIRQGHGLHERIVMENATTIVNLRKRLVKLSGKGTLDAFHASLPARLVPNVNKVEVRISKMDNRQEVLNELLAQQCMIDTRFRRKYIPVNSKYDEAFGKCEDLETWIQSQFTANIERNEDYLKLATADIAREQPFYDWVLAILHMIKESLKMITPKHKAAVMLPKIDSTINIESLRQHVTGKPFNYKEAVGLIKSITPFIIEIQSPDRKMETDQMLADLAKTFQEAMDNQAQIQAFVAGLEFLCDRVRALSVDKSNKR